MTFATALFAALLSASSSDEGPAHDVAATEEGAPAQSPAAHPATLSTVAEGRWELRGGLGIQHATIPRQHAFTPSLMPALALSVNWGVSDRLQVLMIPTPAFAYRLGERGELEWVPWGGMTEWGVGYSPQRGVFFGYGLGVGLGLRSWLDDGRSVIVTGGTTAAGHAGQLGVGLPLTWRASVAVGGSLLLREGVTLHLAASVSGDYLVDGLPRGQKTAYAFGSVQQLAFRRLPLVQVQLSPSWTFDVHISLFYDATERQLTDEYLVGFSWTS